MRRGLVALVVVVVVLGIGLAASPAADVGQFDCLVEPHVLVAISSPVDGLLETVTVDRGDRVEAGQVVAVLESSVEKANVALAVAKAEVESVMQANRVKLDFGVRRFERTKDLYKQDLIPLKELDEAETAKLLAEIAIVEAKENKRVADLELERARAALTLRTVRSPITGVVVERLLSSGEFTRQNPILRLAQLDPLRVDVIVPVALFGRIGVGMAADVTPEAPLNRPLRARVSVVDRVVDAASGTFGVHLELANPGHRLPAGFKCKVRFLP